MDIAIAAPTLIIASGLSLPQMASSRVKSFALMIGGANGPNSRAPLKGWLRFPLRPPMMCSLLLEGQQERKARPRSY